MARIRSLKPEAFQSETLALVSVSAERTFFGLSTQVDDRSRLPFKPVQINADLWAYRPTHTPDDLTQELEQLVSEGLVCVYDGCDGKRYLHLPTWDHHQKIDRPSRSRLPLCPTHTVNLATSADDYCGRHEGPCTIATPRDALASPREPSMQDRGSRTVDLGSVDQKDEDPSSEPDGPDHDEPTRPDVEALCTHLADRIAGNGSKRPTITKRWRTSARLLLDVDERTVEQVHLAIDWCQDDEFWRSNILSMPKLREKYDQLRLKALEQQQTRLGPTAGPRPSTTDQRVADGIALTERLRAQRLAAETHDPQPAIGA